MPWKTVDCTRDELYEQVWSTPVKELTEAYGVSDVGLAKVCRKLGVPKPGRGYWQRKAAGQEVERDPLPPAEDGQPLKHRIRRWEDPEGHVLGDEAVALLAREQEPGMSLTVPKVLRQPHPLVSEGARILRDYRGDWRALAGLQTRRACIDVKAAGDTLERALRIADTLLKGLEKRGFDVRVTKPSGHTYSRSETEVRILGMWIGFSTKENATAVKVKSDSLIWPTKTVNQPNGKLTIKIELATDGVRHSWADGKTQRVEDLLGDFVCALIIAAEDARKARVAAKRREQLRQEETERQREVERLAALEAERVRALQGRLADWREAQQLREFITAVESRARASEHDVAPDSELGRWIAWARDHADALEADAVESVLEQRPTPDAPRRRIW